MMLFLLLHAELGIVLTFEPVSTAAAVTGAALSVAVAGVNFLQCRFGECCDDRWITANITGEFVFVLINEHDDDDDDELYLQLLSWCKRFAVSLTNQCRAEG